ncbi:CCHC-type integrase [Gossypium australe]|uniref:CCHC-type integrase n=1 Tax=Gossypium australe TaxID=47621 RepID=A0A5B6UX49_9ROSI|nr:CCHC-type integrase [Gossypium australe]
MRADARKESSSLCFQTTKVYHLHRLQKSQVPTFTVGVESTAKEMDRVAKDYDSVIEYHPGKANVVVDALSRKLKSKL